MDSENTIPLNVRDRRRVDNVLPRALLGLAQDAKNNDYKSKRAFGTILHHNSVRVEGKESGVQSKPVYRIAKSNDASGGYWNASPVKRARSQINTQKKPNTLVKGSENAPPTHSFSQINKPVADWDTSPITKQRATVPLNENACNAWRYAKPHQQESHFQISSNREVGTTAQAPAQSDLNNSFTEKISNLNLDIREVDKPSVLPSLSTRFLSVNPFPHEQEYVDTILSRWYQLEKMHKINANYMTKQKEISYKMRTILIEWLVEVAGEYAIHNATLHRGVHFVDRFLSRMQVSRNNLQLLGTTCLFLASKIEEIHPPDTQDLVYITDNTYDKTQVLRMECLVLSVLDFDLLTPTAHEFTEYYASVLELSSTTKACCCYLIELTLLHGDKFLKFSGSVISIAACYVAIRIHGDQTHKFKNNRTNEVCIENVISKVMPLSSCVLDNTNVCVSKILLTIISNNDNAVCTKYKKFQEQPFILAATSIAACLPFPLYDSH
ncbi:unnamed protein product [Orchesella dallaii]|uniref:G2/mitotic-specific cyclin-A n=1 Tax=Orchesella dallaii TaxID=48710 RepID=A0ABP1QX30_9HEXA